jgi:hypothetical protein
METETRVPWKVENIGSSQSRRAAENAEKNAEKTKPNKTELRNVAAALSSLACAEEAEGAEKTNQE